MNAIGTINSRNVFYQKHDITIKWDKHLPKENWLAMAIVESNDSVLLYDISKKLIANNACYICCAGPSGELLHDIIDDDIVVSYINDSNDPSFEIITTWHDDIAEAFWFAIFTAENSPISIGAIVCIDCGKNSFEQELSYLFRKFSDGYIPPL